jgi:hypothetical protein
LERVTTEKRAVFSGDGLTMLEEREYRERESIEREREYRERERVSRESILISEGEWSAAFTSANRELKTIN